MEGSGMKYLGFVLLVVLTFSQAQTFDLQAIKDSEGTLDGALEGAFEALAVSTVYLPNYGLHFDISDLIQDGTAQDSINKISELINALSSTVKGLDPSDWLSVSYEYASFDESYSAIVRMKQGQAETLEVFLDGAKQ
jgi:hypothetical protein